MQEHSTTDTPSSEIPYGYCHCGCGQRTPLATSNHPERGCPRGQPVRYCHGHSHRQLLAMRFWAKVQKNEGCWLWTAGTDGHRYGQINAGRTNGKVVPAKASRVAWELAYGPIPEGMEICHSCDNPPCVRPDHLFLGTHKDNMGDMAAKGHSNRGERSPVAKLTAASVLAIRAERQAEVPVSTIATHYSVSVRTVYAILEGRLWSHV